ncbi:MAG: substrate-binding domain-containing protein [Spirochaetales bacterium]|nr:substrate-binding domain-containing protein [Spirochaetales bacterium]
MKPKKRRSSKNPLTIGFVISALFDIYTYRIWAGVVRRAREQNVNLLIYNGGIFDFDWRVSEIRNCVYDVINTRQLDGLILASSIVWGYTDRALFSEYVKRWQSLPLVSIGIHDKHCTNILIDNEKEFKKLIKHLICDHNYRNIAFIKGPDENIDTIIRLRTYKKVLAEESIEFREEYVASGQFIHDSGVAAAKLFLDERKLKLDAVVAANDTMAIGFIQELQRRGIKVPEEIAVVGFDDSEYSACIYPPLSTVRQNPEQIGETAVDAILDVIMNQVEVKDITLSSEMVIRQSCGCSISLPLNIDSKLIPADYISSTVTPSNWHGVKKRIEKLITQCVGSSKAHPNHRTIYNFLLDKAEYLFLTKNHDGFLTGLQKELFLTIESNGDLRSWSDCAACFFSICNHLAKDKDDKASIQKIWNSCMQIIARTAENSHALLRRIQRRTGYDYYSLTERLYMTSKMHGLKDVLGEYLSRYSIPGCSVFQRLQRKGSSTRVRLISAFDKDSPVIIQDTPVEVDVMDMLSPDFFRGAVPKILLIMNLYSGNQDLGFIVFKMGPLDGILYETITMNISGAIRLIQIVEKERTYSQKLALQVYERTEELEKANREIKLANEQLKMLDKLKNEFIANISHDFRSPLMVVLNMAELGMLSRDPELSEHLHNYETITKAGLRLKTSIDRLLDLVKMDSGIIDLNIQKINALDYINSIIDFYSASIATHKIRIDTELDVKADAAIFTDPEKLESILGNVISNAVKFVPEINGTITIGLKEKLNAFLFFIRDNGIGIDPEKLDVIFNRFEQIHNVQAIPYRGTGIGLAFCKQLVTALKGRIWAESKGQNQGAVFYIELPKGKAAFHTYLQSAKGKNHNKTASSMDEQQIVIDSIMEKKFQNKENQIFIDALNKAGEFDPYRALILIIDDELEIRTIVHRYLRDAGYKNFILAANGILGLDAIKEYQPDLIVCDNNMPGLRGHELYDRIQSDQESRDIPIIFLSAVTRKNTQLKKHEKKTVVQLEKPIEKEIFYKVVKQSLQKYFEFKKQSLA